MHVGPVPGPKNQIIRVQDAMGKPWPAGPMSVSEIVPKSIVAQPEITSTIEAAEKVA